MNKGLYYKKDLLLVLEKYRIYSENSGYNNFLTDNLYVNNKYTWSSTHMYSIWTNIGALCLANL